MGDQAWYYHHGGNQYGPVSFEQLQQAAARGEVLPQDLVWQQGLPSWVAASTVSSLFPAPAPPPAPPPSAPPPPPAAPPAPKPTLAERRAKVEGHTRGFLERLPHVALVDAVLDWYAKVLSQDRLDALDRGLKNVGHVAYVCSTGLAFVIAVVMAIKVNNLMLFLAAMAVIPVAVLLHYVAVMFLDAGKAVLERSPSAMSSRGFLRVYALLMLVEAVAYVLWGIIRAIQTNQVTPLGYVLLAVFALYVAAVALSPKTVNVAVGGEVSAGEEAIGILCFLFKISLRQVPIVFGIGAVAGALGLLYLLVAIFAQPLVAMAVGIPIAAVALGIALAPFVIYLVFMLLYLAVDVLRSILVVPSKLDRLAVAAAKAQEAPE